MVDFVR